MRMFVVALVVLATSPAMAANAVSSWGAGNYVCRDAFSDPQLTAQIQPWVEGYLSATAKITRGHEHPQAGIGLASDIETFCQSHPDATVGSALAKAMKPLGR